MIVIDKTTGQKWQIFVADGQIGNRVVISGVAQPPIIREDNAPSMPLTTQQISDFFLTYGQTSSDYNWELIVEDSNLGVTKGGLSPTHPWVRDEVTPSIVWEFRVDGGQLYISELNITGLGRIVYLLTGTVYQVQNVGCPFTFGLNLINKIYEEIDLNCLIPQEEFA